MEAFFSKVANKIATEIRGFFFMVPRTVPGVSKKVQNFETNCSALPADKAVLYMSADILGDPHKVPLHVWQIIEQWPIALLFRHF